MRQTGRGCCGATASCGFADGSWLLLVILDSGDGELSHEECTRVLHGSSYAGRMDAPSSVLLGATAAWLFMQLNVSATRPGRTAPRRARLGARGHRAEGNHHRVCRHCPPRTGCHTSPSSSDDAAHRRSHVASSSPTAPPGPTPTDGEPLAHALRATTSAAPSPPHRRLRLRLACAPLLLGVAVSCAAAGLAKRDDM